MPLSFNGLGLLRSKEKIKVRFLVGVLVTKMNYKRKRKYPKSVKCALCMSQKLVHGKYSHKEKVQIKLMAKEVKEWVGSKGTAS